MNFKDEKSETHPVQQLMCVQTGFLTDFIQMIMCERFSMYVTHISEFQCVKISVFFSR